MIKLAAVFGLREAGNYGGSAMDVFGVPDSSGARGGVNREPYEREDDFPYDRTAPEQELSADLGSDHAPEQLHVSLTPMDTSHSAWDDANEATGEYDGGVDIGDPDRMSVQLAGVSVAAQGGAHGPNDAEEGDYGWSLPFNDVKELRARHDKMMKALGFETADEVDEALAEADYMMVGKAAAGSSQGGQVEPGTSMVVKPWDEDDMEPELEKYGEAFKYGARQPALEPGKDQPDEEIPNAQLGDPLDDPDMGLPDYDDSSEEEESGELPELPGLLKFGGEAPSPSLSIRRLYWRV